MEFLLTKKKKRKPFWFEHNQDAKGYQYGDNRALTGVAPDEDRRDMVRRTWNI